MIYFNQEKNNNFNIIYKQKDLINNKSLSKVEKK